jgi:hypothetical protein
MGSRDVAPLRLVRLPGLRADLAWFDCRFTSHTFTLNVRGSSWSDYPPFVKHWPYLAGRQQEEGVLENEMDD